MLFMKSEAPAAIPSHERPSIVEIVLPLVLSCAANEPAENERRNSENNEIIMSQCIMYGLNMEISLK